jgi:hypothetical protein
MKRQGWLPSFVSWFPAVMHEMKIRRPVSLDGVDLVADALLPAFEMTTVCLKSEDCRPVLV